MTKSEIKRQYKLMMSHLKHANDHHRLANEIANRLEPYLDPFQDPAPKRGKSNRTEIRSALLAKRLQRVAHYKTY